MPKKQIDDDEDIIEIEEFTEPSRGSAEPKPEKSVKKQNTDKKAKIKSPKGTRIKAKKQPPPESEDSQAEIEDDEDEEDEEDEKPTRKNKTKITSKKAISEKRLEVLKKGREVAAANRAKKKEEQIAKLKKELWEDFNGKVQVPPKPQSTKSEQQPPQPSTQPQEIISKMKERSSLEFVPSGRPMKSFIKIK
jgi:hypothetical protein